jgi:GalNAc-alpha-(1->4)-GalNAc-alpha-(1->3)-diNAcBac-PP-undecaprenol alpha-1,4-N-acetyl-D-galactosaminyltransferase
MSKKTIGFVITSMQSGGAEKVMSILVNNFSEEFNVHLFVYNTRPSFYPIRSDVKIHYLFYNEINRNKFHLLWDHFSAFFTLKSLCNKNKIDCIVSFTTTINVLSIILGKISSIPVIISERYEPLHYHINGKIALLRRIFYRYATEIVFQTARVESSFSKLKVKLPKKKSVIYNPIDNKFKSEGETRQNIILSVGRLTHEKGHDLLLNSFSLIKKKGWILNIIGDGANKEKLIELTKELEISDSVFFLGKQKNIESYLSQSSIFVMPSRTEGFPNALCEAMISGCAVVSFDCPNGPGEIIQNNFNGLLAEQENIYQMATYIDSLIENESLRLELGSNATKLSELLDESIICKQWKQLVLQNILKK